MPLANRYLYLSSFSADADNLLRSGLAGSNYRARIPLPYYIKSCYGCLKLLRVGFVIVASELDRGLGTPKRETRRPGCFGGSGRRGLFPVTRLNDILI